jgi:hypothetical protein
VDTQNYERALARAKAEGCRIVGESAYNGNRAWVVVNPAHDGLYVVRLAAGAKELTCNCPARVPCKHRALVHEALEAERAPRWGSTERQTFATLRIDREAALQSSLWR